MHHSPFSISAGLLLLLCALFAALPVAAAQGDDPLVVGVFPRRNATITYTMFSPLMSRLERELGRAVRLVTAKDFAAFWRQVEAREFDLVHFNPYHYLKARGRHGYRVVLMNEERGARALSGAVVTRIDCGCDSLEDLRGRTVIFGGGPSAMFSYIAPRYLLQQAGIGEQEYETRYAINPPNAVISVAQHQSEAAGCGEVVLALPMVTERVDTSALKVLAKSEPLAHLPWAVRDDMDPALRERLVAVLDGLDEREEGRVLLKRAGLTALHPATDEAYRPHERMIEAVFGADHLR